MKKTATILLIIVAFVSNAQTITDSLGLYSLRSYTEDKNGNYWFTNTSNEFYFYNGDSIKTVSSDRYTDVWAYDDKVAMVCQLKPMIYYYNLETQEISDSLETYLFQIKSSFLQNNEIMLLQNGGIFFINGEMVELPSAFAVYENGNLTLIDTTTVPELYYNNNATIKPIKYDGSYYISGIDGLYKYGESGFEKISAIVPNSYAIWNDQLWMAADGIYVLIDGVPTLPTPDAKFHKANDLHVYNNQLWSLDNVFNSISKITYTGIDVYSLEQSSYYFPNQYHGNSVSFFISSLGLATFDSEINTPFTTSDVTYTKELSVNQVRAAYSMSNSIFWNLADAAKYEVPKDSGVNSMFASSVWFGGMTPDNEVRTNGDMHFTDNVRLFPGPIQPHSCTTTEETIKDYSKMWYMNRGIIENFKYRYENGHVTNGTWPVFNDLTTWPAHGSQGYSDNLAPFVDVNNDNIYNPLDGDYPELKGDEMLYWILNDYNFYDPQASFSKSMGLELHFTAWAKAYEDAPNDTLDIINYTTFLDIDVINRSDTTYHNFYLGFFSDFDLGNPFDDFVGCDVTNSSFYIYNSDDFDEDGGSPGYGENPPVQTVTFLNAPMQNTLDGTNASSYLSKFMFFNNSSDEIVGDPNTSEEYYNYLTGHWKNGDTLKYGGTGYSNTTDIACDYMWPGNSDPHHLGTGGIDPGFEWSEVSEGNEPDDRHGIGSNGPYTLEPGQKISYRIAFVWVRDDGEKISSLDKMHELLPYLHNYQNTGEFPSNYTVEIVPLGVSNVPAEQSLLNIYPNPAKETVTVQTTLQNATCTIYDLAGKIVAKSQLSNMEQAISVSSLNKGIYLLNVANGNQSITNKLVIE